MLKLIVNIILHKLPFEGDIPPHTSLPGNESLQLSNVIMAPEVCHTQDIQHTYWQVCMEATVFISNHHHLSLSTSASL